ncbi:ABC transporter ATP-binding protein [Salipiger sp. H15]|uniref:ABC transporter ATP-binding protein n=1 Tax=Alloyangia sp. H15 TaxID=3029062 RepID=A0AAU8ALT5_9RHOB
MTLLDVRNLTKTFGAGRGRRVVAVDDVSFTVAKGETLGLVGESGSGKSTLSRLVCGLALPDSGTVHVDGAPLVPGSGRVQMVFQSADEALNPAFSIARNIGVGLGLSTATADDAIRGIAQEVGLPLDLLGRRPHQLSGGQQARAGIARALISKPELLLLDEPTAALDVSVQALVLRLLHRMRGELGCGMLLISHDLDVVRLMCDRVMVIYHGRIVEEGPVAQITRAPRHPYTRALLAATPGARRAPAPERAERMAELRADACHFRASCPMATAACGQSRPRLAQVGAGHSAACHALVEAAGAAPVSESAAC